jgi:catechol 2,3-dioxygenase-like lactoylglutathione lyase family enzyme
MEKRAEDKSAFKNWHHVGAVVRDINKAIAGLSSLGIGPIGMPDGQTITEVQLQGEVRGKPAVWKMKISMARVGDLDLELLQPAGGESVLQEFIDSGHEGIHHVAYLVDDFQGEAAGLVRQGAKVIMSGKADRGGFAYLETGSGIIIELRQL